MGSMNESPPEQIAKVREWMAAAEAIAVLTGAGISAESGVPTFRGSGGLWRNFRPEDLATPEAFARNPQLVWEWYNWRRGLVAKARPNPGHKALAQLEARKSKFTLITQNVDGLHDSAGSRNILKLHGDIWQIRCTQCLRSWIDRKVPLAAIPPHCECGALARPDIVWFGEALPAGVWTRAWQAVQSAQLLLVIGTSGVVYPAADLVPLAMTRGAKVVEINPDTTPFSETVDCALNSPAGEILPQLLPL
jgi:NAD-dependent deacetylase